MRELIRRLKHGDAITAVSALEHLFVTHGPLLLAKADNGSPTTFYEKGRAVKTESSPWFPAWKRFNLLSAAHCLDDPDRSEHGIGSRGGIFSGSWVNSPNGRVMLAGLSPLHDAGTIFAASFPEYRCCRFFWAAWVALKPPALG
jgi:hypothetical protein